ncbi:MAG: penicillin acylase family protein [Gemmatimonadaceae bacterium]
MRADPAAPSREPLTASVPAAEPPAAPVERARGARTARTLLALIVLAGAAYVGARPAGPLPPLGPLLDPARGAWGTVRATAMPREESREIPGLAAPVRVVTDVRGVPHVFAASEDDVYRALGYLVARERLFQIELQWRAAAGRLSELAGARAVALDSTPRRLGLPEMARRKLAALSADSGLLRAARAYADGVNAYIDQMPASAVPVEYRLLGARPTRWEPEHAVHLLNRMAWMLSFDEGDLRKERVAAVVGRQAADALFPLEAPIQEPIQPNGQTAPRVELRPLPPPGPPDPVARLSAALGERMLRTLGGMLDAADEASGDAIGSNNWAVAPQRTKAGRAILAGDPHLGMTLPSIWYEAHLVVPGRLDVYGVTIPGAPSIVIGFNRDVAWTFTNTDAADVIDYYAEQVDDAARPTRYMLDGAWRPLRRVVEEYRAPDGSVAATDTVLYTHRGPLVRDSGRWLSLRWTAYEMTNEGDALLRAERARSVDEWLDATAGWGVPAQNMLVADRAGSIAIRSTGRFPIRPGNGRGDAVFDGRTSAADWTGFLPVSRLPQAVRPAQGFLASANQQSVDPRTSDAYLGFGWLDPWRALRINEILRADSQVTPETMRRMQTDPGSPRADRFVPIFVAAGSLPGAPADAREAARLLGEWDRRYTTDNRRAVLFEYAMRELTDRTWDELSAPGAVDASVTSGADRAGAARRVATPSAMALLQLVADPASPWWDDRRTTGVVETRDAVLQASLAAALARARHELGEPADDKWLWSRNRRANVWHVLNLRGFSQLGIPVQGGPSTLSPSSGDGRHGASWRMVVELGPEVRAWTIYPGGQSGNPASSRYADRIGRWARGELDPALLPRTPDALRPADVLSTLTLTPRK